MKSDTLPTLPLDELEGGKWLCRSMLFLFFHRSCGEELAGRIVTAASPT
jgi:hypothetical protein